MTNSLLARISFAVIPIEMRPERPSRTVSPLCNVSSSHCLRLLLVIFVSFRSLLSSPCRQTACLSVCVERYLSLVFPLVSFSSKEYVKKMQIRVGMFVSMGLVVDS
jgi:hypothetical protein